MEQRHHHRVVVDPFENVEVPLPFVRSTYNYDMMAASNRSGLHCQDPSLAVQDAKDEVDINTIVRRFGLTGELPSDVRAPTFGDFTGVGDYHQAMNAIALANEAFEEMPAEVRYRFHNDPGEFVEFCSREENREEMKALGLLAPVEAAQAVLPPEQVSTPVEVAKTPPA